ncbi:MAG: phospholipase [Hymenobacteraceae bacterium]|nr:phospholipase [Hymenobacteraceae bacterium]
MDALSHSLTVARPAHYYTLGQPTAATRELWFVLHGYGQLAEFFIRHFRVLTDDAEPERTVIVAPEALNKFYLDGTHGRVGATWMTKDKREPEITAYVNYLNQLYALLRPLAPAARVTLLGFSQGTATVSRWLTALPEAPAQLVLWAGAFPEDMVFTAAPSLLTGATQLHTVLGDDDPFVTPESKIRQVRFIESHGLRPIRHTFRGGHTLDAGVLRALQL